MNTVFLESDPNVNNLGSIVVQYEGIEFNKAINCAIGMFERYSILFKWNLTQDKELVS